MSMEIKAGFPMAVLKTSFRPSLSYITPPFIIIIISLFSNQWFTPYWPLTYFSYFFIGAILATGIGGVLQVLDYNCRNQWNLYETDFVNIEIVLPPITSYALIVLSAMLLRWNKLYV